MNKENHSQLKLVLLASSYKALSCLLAKGLRGSYPSTNSAQALLMKLGSGSLGLGEALCSTWAYGIVLVMLKLLPAVFMSLVAYQLVMNSCARDCWDGCKIQNQCTDVIRGSPGEDEAGTWLSCWVFQSWLTALEMTPDPYFSLASPSLIYSIMSSVWLGEIKLCFLEK